MTKKDYIVRNITWDIERATNNLQEALNRVMSEASQENPAMVSPLAIQHAAMDIAECQTKLNMLHQQLKMIEFMTENDDK